MRIILLALVAAFASGQALASEAFGVWARGDGVARVRIAPCGAVLCATNVWVNDPSGKEAVGDKLVLTVQPTPTGYEGKAYDPKRDLNFGFELRVDRDRMTTRYRAISDVRDPKASAATLNTWVVEDGRAGAQRA